MNIKTFVVGALASNCYAVEKGETILIIDPGFMTRELSAYITENAAKIKAVLLTHRHIDHLSAVAEIKDATNAPIVIHADDEIGLYDENANLSSMMEGMYGFKKIPKADILAEDNDMLQFSDIAVRVLHTPGHSEGGLCYIIENHIFSGDTLFCGSVGRTDFPGGNYKTMMKSLQRLKLLTGDYDIHSGHGEQTTLESERRTNPYMEK